MGADGRQWLSRTGRAMQLFLCAEKEIYPVTPQRLAIDENDKPVGGKFFSSYAHASAFGPERGDPFEIKGVWIPAQECIWAAGAKDPMSPLFRRENEAGTFFLFLVHPDSETLYQPLLKQFGHGVNRYLAVSMSSLRSLLVEIPDATGAMHYFFVKLSVNQTINNALRVLSKKECMSSIGSAIVLQNFRNEDMDFMRDLWTVVPKATAIDHSVMDTRGVHGVIEQCGMIVRAMPDFLMANDGQRELLPFFSLFHQNDLLETMVAASGLTVTNFLLQFLLQPFARVFVDLLFFHHISLEAHGQNLLWVISAATGLPECLMYRDMGGVNMLRTAENMALLPADLQSPDYFYEETHLDDACGTLEDHWVGSVLFNLNKRLLRSESLKNGDSALRAWAVNMADSGALCNWQLPGDRDSAAHQQRIPQSIYRRYGYLEEIFKHCLTAELYRREIPQTLARTYSYLPALMEGYATPAQEGLTAWFEPLIYTLYSHWLVTER